MKDLRSEVREAFQKEQSAHPPVAGMRRSIVEAATARPPRRELRLQWLAVAAVLVISALLIVTLASHRLGVHQVVPSHHAPTGDYGPPPAGVPLVYAGDPNHPGWYIGFDWSGHPRGTIKLALAQQLGQSELLMQSPDGSGFAYSLNGKGGMDLFLDRLGQPIANTDTTVRYQDAIWADDSKHLCTLGGPPQPPGGSGEWDLGVRVPGAPPVTHSVALDQPSSSTGIIAWGLRSCSPSHDRAIITFNYFGLPMQIYVVRLSDGAITFHSAYAANTVADIVASPDSSLYAVSSSQSNGYIGGSTAETTTVVRLSDGATLVKTDPSIQVLGFSADDKTVLMATSPWVEGAATHMIAMDIAAGNTVWRYDGDEQLVEFRVNPTGAGFALFLKTVGDSRLHASVDIVLVDAHGTETKVPGQYQRP
jgi:hypothetical protein